RNKSAAEPNVSTLRLTERSKLLSASRMDSSSSTSNTVGSSALASGRAGRSITIFSRGSRTCQHKIALSHGLACRIKNKGPDNPAALAFASLRMKAHLLFMAALNQGIKGLDRWVIESIPKYSSSADRDEPTSCVTVKHWPSACRYCRN